MMRIAIIATGAAALFLAPSASLAQAQQMVPAPTPAPLPGYAMPSTQMWDMQSDAGETYRILVSYPTTEMPADGYPVLYVLDGNALFAGFAEARRIQEYYDIGKMIVVGVGYPTDQAYDVRRLNDYTPPMLDPPPPALRRLAQYKSGGQDRFLDFLTGKLRPRSASATRSTPIGRPCSAIRWAACSRCTRSIRGRRRSSRSSRPARRSNGTSRASFAKSAPSPSAWRAGRWAGRAA